ncbi:sensor histidine kinase [Alicyclobacillus kakegawensis]|uniref:sensor histidine kinase n=1 Tax=Alicyclobacillus kakegawensis TaxID=392012 RepID=UPI00082DA2CC|nr:ATP-binding protein [Alicyclobacillus kakegawensis]
MVWWIGLLLALWLVTCALWRVDVVRRNRFLRHIADVARQLAHGQFDAKLSSHQGRAEVVVFDAVNHMIQMLAEHQERLRAERDLLEHILQHLTSGVVFVSHLGRIERMNEAAARLLRRPRAQCLGLEYWTVFRGHPEVAAALTRALFHGDPWQDALVVEGGVTVEARVVPLPLAMTPRFAEQRPFEALILLHDISQWQRLERMRSDFVANVSHELKTPITSIRGFAETLLGDSVSPDVQSDFLREIVDEAKRMENLVADLLTLSRLETADAALELAPVDMDEVIDKALTRVRSEAAHHGILLEAAPACDVLVWADADRILQVLLNLLTNAIHYTPAGGRVKVHCEVSLDHVRVHVQDTGIGIPEDQQQRVFERFYRVDKDRSRATGGTGLGLAIVKHIVGLHGGDLGLTSTPGQGSDFWFTLARLTGDRAPGAPVPRKP